MIDDHDSATGGPPENPEQMWNRSRAFQEAMADAKVDPAVQNIVLYIAHHCDFHGVSRVTLAYVADKLGKRSRGTIQRAVHEAAIAGFLTSEVDPRSRRRTIYRVPMMAAPGSRRVQLRETVAQLQNQMREGFAQNSTNCAIAVRAPSKEEIEKEEGNDRNITREPSSGTFDLHEEIDRLQDQLRRTAAADPWGRR